jgi:hypothetical protein
METSLVASAPLRAATLGLTIADLREMLEE